MSKVILEESNLKNIASAIRARNGLNDEKYKPSEMPAAIRQLYKAPCIIGEFTGLKTETLTININYFRGGYPIMLLITVKPGLTQSGTKWYTTVQRYAVGQFLMTKARPTISPVWTTTSATDRNYGVVSAMYKSSSSSATSMARSGSNSAASYTTSTGSATASLTTCARFIATNKLSVHCDTSTYGFMPDVEYEYIIVYSS